MMQQQASAAHAAHSNFAITMDEDTSAFCIDGIPQLHPLAFNTTLHPPPKASMHNASSHQQQQQQQLQVSRVFSGPPLLVVNTSSSPVNSSARSSAPSSTSPPAVVLTGRGMSDRSVVSVASTASASASHLGQTVSRSTPMDTSQTPKAVAPAPSLATLMPRSWSSPAFAAAAGNGNCLPRVESDQGSLSSSQGFTSSPDSMKESSAASSASPNHLDMLCKAVGMMQSPSSEAEETHHKKENERRAPKGQQQHHSAHPAASTAAAAKEFNRGAMVREDAAASLLAKSKLPSGLNTFNGSSYLVSRVHARMGRLNILTGALWQPPLMLFLSFPPPERIGVRRLLQEVDLVVVRCQRDHTRLAVLPIRQHICSGEAVSETEDTEQKQKGKGARRKQLPLAALA